MVGAGSLPSESGVGAGPFPSERSLDTRSISEYSINSNASSNLASPLNPVRGHTEHATCALQENNPETQPSGRSRVRSRSQSLSQSSSEYPKKSSRIGETYQATDLPRAIAYSEYSFPGDSQVEWQPLWNPKMKFSDVDDKLKLDEDNLAEFLQISAGYKVSEEAALYVLLSHDGDTRKAICSLRATLEGQQREDMSTTSTSNEGSKEDESEAWLSVTYRPKEWTASEEDIFAASIVSTLKDFGKVALELEGRSKGDCIHYYYSRFKRRRGVRTRQSNLSNRRKPLATQNNQTPQTPGNVAWEEGTGADGDACEHRDVLQQNLSRTGLADTCEPALEGGYERLKKAMAKRNRVQLEEDRRNVTECTSCGDGGSLLCCDNCSNAYHLACLDPPLSKVPEGDWQCLRCSARRRKKMANAELAALRQAAAAAVRNSRFEASAAEGASNERLSRNGASEQLLSGSAGNASNGTPSLREVYRLSWSDLKDFMLLDGWNFSGKNVCGSDDPLYEEASTQQKSGEMLLSWHSPPVVAKVIGHAKARDQWEHESWLTVHKDDSAMETVVAGDFVKGKNDSSETSPSPGASWVSHKSDEGSRE